MKLGEKIKFYRNEMNLSQEELGSKISVTKATISNWEAGIRIPDGDKVGELAKLFGVSTDYLLGIVDIDEDEIKMINKMIRQAGITKNIEDLTKEELENAIEFAYSTKKIYNKNTKKDTN